MYMFLRYEVKQSQLDEYFLSHTQFAYRVFTIGIHTRRVLLSCTSGADGVKLWRAQLINQMVLNNRRMYSDLKTKLLLSDVERKRRLQLQWTKQLDAWKQAQTDAAVQQFRYDSLMLFALISSLSSGKINKAQLPERHLNFTDTVYSGPISVFSTSATLKITID